MELFLMFCSGVGRVAAGMRMRGISTLEIDIKHGSHFDLTDARIQKKVLKLARRHRICGACIGMPCTSFSLARNRTRVIRTCEFPWGLGGRELWSKNDVKSLELGNELASFTIKLIKIFHLDLGKSFYQQCLAFAGNSTAHDQSSCPVPTSRHVWLRNPLEKTHWPSMWELQLNHVAAAT